MTDSDCRPPEPDWLKKWRQQRNTPQCCHTCDFYTEGGYCEKHEATPPAEFAETVGTCPDWKDEIPF